MKLTINDVVTNLVKNDPSQFLADMMETEPGTRVVRAIFVRDMTTEEKGYTKSVDTSSDPEAIVYLVGSYEKYRLADLVTA